MAKYVLVTGAFLILAVSAISMVKPAFYLMSLDTSQQLELELGPPEEVISEQEQTIFRYQRGPMKPLCVDYRINFRQGRVTDWTWKVCR
jgi:hypothetical protein